MTGATGCGRWGYIAVAAGASLALEGALVTMARKSIPNNLKQQLETDCSVNPCIYMNVVKENRVRRSRMQRCRDSFMEQLL